MSMTMLFGLDVKDTGSAKLDKFAGKVKTLGSVSTDVGNKMSMAFANAVMFKSLDQLLKVIESSTQSVKDFSTEIATFKVLSGEIPTNVAKTSNEFRLLALNVQQSSTQIAQAANEFQRMGVSSSDTLMLLPRTMDLITAGGADVTVTMETVATALNSFKIPAKDASWAMNQMQASADKSMSSFGDIAEGFKEVAPIASQFGVSFHDTLTLLGEISNSGLRGERGGTALKNMLTGLLKPSGDVAKAMKGMSLEGMSFMDIIQKLGNSKDVKIQGLLKTFTLRGFGPALYLKDHLDDYNKLSKAINDNGQIVQKMAEAKRKSLGLELDQAKKLTQELGVNFVGALLQVSSSSKPLDGILAKLKDMNKELINNPQVVASYAHAFEQLGKVLEFGVQHIEAIERAFALFAVSKGVGFISTTFKVLKKDIDLLTSTWTLNQVATFKSKESLMKLGVSAETAALMLGKTKSETVKLTAEEARALAIEKEYSLALKQSGLALETKSNLLTVATEKSVIARTAAQELSVAEAEAAVATSRMGNSLKILTNSNVWLIAGTVIFELITHFSDLEKQVRATKRSMDDFSESGKVENHSLYTDLLDALNPYILRQRELTKELRLQDELLALAGGKLNGQQVVERQAKEDELKKLNSYQSSSSNDALGGLHFGAKMIEDLRRVATDHNKNFETIMSDIGTVIKTPLETESGGTLNDLVATLSGKYNVTKPKIDVSPDDPNHLGKVLPVPSIGKKVGSKDLSGSTLREYFTNTKLVYEETKKLKGLLKSVNFYDLYKPYEKEATFTYKLFDHSGKKITEHQDKLKVLNLEADKLSKQNLNKTLQKETKALGSPDSELVDKDYLKYLDSAYHELTKIYNLKNANFKTRGEVAGTKDLLSTESTKRFSETITQSLERINKTHFNIFGEFYIGIAQSKKEWKELTDTFNSYQADKNISPKEKAKQRTEYDNVMSDKKKNDLIADGQDIQKAYEDIGTSLSMIWDIQSKKMEDKHNKEMSNLEEESSTAINLAGNNAIRKAQIEQDYAKKKTALTNKQHAESVEFAKKQKILAISQATISLAQAELGVAAAQFGDIWAKGAAMTAMGILGGVQIATIASQKYASGSHGVVKSDRRGSSDLIPAMLSEGEIVTSKKEVDRLGGEEGFKQMLNQSSGISTNRGEIHYHIGQVYGSEQYVRDLFKKLTKEKEVWQY